VIDADDYKNGCAFATLEDEYGPLPPTMEARTPGDGKINGRQLHYRTLPGTPTLRTGNNQLGRFVDVKGEGEGYVILPPSRRAVGAYEWKDTSAAEPEIAPDWMIETLLDKSVSRVDSSQRFKRGNPCPVCGGGSDDPHGKGVRCYGFLSSDRRFAHCTREERSGGLSIERNGTTFAHQLSGVCRCSRRHDGGRPAPEESVGGRAATEMSAVAPEIRLTDKGNGIRFANQNRGRVLFSQARKKFLVFDGRRFIAESTCQAEGLAKATAETIWAEAAAEPDDAKRTELRKHALRSESSRALLAMLQCARSEPGIAIDEALLDPDPMLLNARNGTIDLRAGVLRDHDPGDLITRLVNLDYKEDATCPVFDRCLSTFMQGDVSLIEFIWQLLGYCLTGSVREQKLLMAIGPTRTFKSTLIAVFQGILGDYAVTASPDLLLASKWGSNSRGPSEDIARLRGARFVSCVETDEDKRLSIARVKMLTGGKDKLTARFLHENSTTFDATFKILLATNFAPVVEGDEAAWSRIVRIPFTVQIPEGDIDLDFFDKKLRPELPGILTSAVAACLRWQKAGRLALPTKVSDAVRTYREDEDVVGMFIEEQCETTGIVRKSELYERFRYWFKRSYGESEEPLSSNALGRRLHDKGFEDKRTSGGAHIWRNLSTRDVTE
jgi:putative DNA primase/helicase